MTTLLAERHRFPFQPLERLVPHLDGECRTRELAEWLGVSERQVFRYRKRGLTRWAADRLACHLGLVPEIVFDDWGEW